MSGLLAALATVPALADPARVADRADALLYWCNGQTATLRDVPGFDIIELPPDLAVHFTLGMAVVSDEPAALQLASFLVSEKGQAIFAEHGLVPLSGPAIP